MGIALCTAWWVSVWSCDEKADAHRTTAADALTADGHLFIPPCCCVCPCLCGKNSAELYIYHADDIERIAAKANFSNSELEDLRYRMCMPLPEDSAGRK